MNKPTGIAKESTAQAARGAQADIELRPANHSDQPILANFVALQATPGLVFLDFGFLDLQAINSLARLANDEASGRASFRGRLACRVALTGDTVASLVRQLNQLLQAPRHEQAGQAHRPEDAAPAAREPSLH